jgi:hypothetical protein
MHCIWTLPEDDTDYSGRWWDIKVRFSKALPEAGVRRPEGLARDGRGIWQKRFWEHTIRDERDYRNHMAAWHYSTFQECAALGGLMHGLSPITQPCRPAWANAAKDGGMRFAFPPYDYSVFRTAKK